MIVTEVFQDIEPIPQDDGPHPVCAIDYPEKFVEAMDYLRALIQIDEHSERALQLTALCLRYNPANYTTWWYRRRCLSALALSKGGKSTSTNDGNADGNVNDGSNGNDNDNNNDNNSGNGNDNGSGSGIYYDFKRIMEDLELASAIGGSNPKNYQIWYHRRSLLELSFEKLEQQEQQQLESKSESESESEPKFDGKQLARNELKYIAGVLQEDSKNYHAWSHRQWILKTINDDELWSNEMKYTTQLIDEDVRNNSAWNQRWLTTHRGKNKPLSIYDARSEADYAIEITTLDPYNESPLRYLVALLREQQNQNTNHSSSEEQQAEQGGGETIFLSFLNHVEEKIGGLHKSLIGVYESSSLMAAYIDLMEMKHDLDSFEKASVMANDLGVKFDIVRKKYWLMREAKLKSKVLELRG